MLQGNLWIMDGPWLKKVIVWRAIFEVNTVIFYSGRVGSAIFGLDLENFP